MGRQLLNKFIGDLEWIIVGILVTSSIATAYSQADTCQNPAPPIITGSAKAICRNESVTLTATGCSDTVVWSNGETGNSICIKPQQTTNYTAICRTRPGCISCFAEVWKITVNTPNAPVVSSLAKITCPNDVVTLTATNCSGIVHWTDQTIGKGWVGKLQQTTTFQASCEQKSCLSNPSVPTTVQIAIPAKPIISASQKDICAGQASQLIASGCLGTVRWMDGNEGIIRTVMPYKTMVYRAVCQVGSCRSDSSESVSVQVREVNKNVNLATTLRNGCPFQTADLSKAIAGEDPALSDVYQFRMGPSLTTAAVQSPGAVQAGTYYIFGRNTNGCYTDPVAVTVQITPCQNPVPVCLSNPATVAVRLDSVDWAKGFVLLTAQLGGSASSASWQSDGSGLFTDTGLSARYLLSETDRQLGKTVFTIVTTDPDGSGPCVSASGQQAVIAPSRELIGLSKKVSEPIWLTEGSTSLVELTYQLTVVDLGTNPLKNVQLTDDLDAAFSTSGALIRTVSVRADSSLMINAAYTGRGADTTLLRNGKLVAGQQSRVWLTVRLDVSRASTLTFSNKASALGMDVNGNFCRDRSTNGTESDPDLNGNPGDNSEPTVVTLH